MLFGKCRHPAEKNSMKFMVQQQVFKIFRPSNSLALEVMQCHSALESNFFFPDKNEMCILGKNKCASADVLTASKPGQRKQEANCYL